MNPRATDGVNRPVAIEQPDRTDSGIVMPTRQSYVEFALGLQIEMIWIPGGKFLMGSPEREVGRYSDEVQHEVRLDGYWIGKYPITDSQWKACMLSLPHPSTSRLPACDIAWEDATAFTRKLTELTGRTYSLPSEAMWEFACRAGSATRYSCGDDALELARHAWFDRNALDGPREVGLLLPNEFGLYDMHGNVWEWCTDWYGQLEALPVSNPTGSPFGQFRVRRGGAWGNGSWRLRSAHRGHHEPPQRSGRRGLRVVCVP